MSDHDIEGQFAVLLGEFTGDIWVGPLSLADAAALDFASGHTEYEAPSRKQHRNRLRSSQPSR